MGSLGTYGILRMSESTTYYRVGEQWRRVQYYREAAAIESTVVGAADKAATSEAKGAAATVAEGAAAVAMAEGATTVEGRGQQQTRQQ